MDNLTIMPQNDLFFERLWALIDNTKTCCWIITYAFEKGFTSEETLRRLISAASRGVNVVLYIDGIYPHENNRLIDLLKLKGGKVEFLNPMTIKKRLEMGLNIFTREIFERFHQKLCIFDSNIVIGSSNITNDYASSIYGNMKFHDLNLLIKNCSIRESKKVFYDIASRFNYKLDTFHSEEAENPDCFILSSCPHKKPQRIQEKLLDLINGAKSKIIIVQGYYYHVPKIKRALKSALDRGVEVLLITSKKRDQPVYKYIDNYKMLKKLIRRYADVYEYSLDIVLHPKLFIIDNEALVGSFNCDKWSWSINNEICINVKNPEIVNELKDYAYEILKRSNKVSKKSLSFYEKTRMAFWDIFLNFCEQVMSTKKKKPGM